MKINMKKLLLTGTAIVAVGAISSVAQAATYQTSVGGVTVNTTTLAAPDYQANPVVNHDTANTILTIDRDLIDNDNGGAANNNVVNITAGGANSGVVINSGKTVSITGAGTGDALLTTGDIALGKGVVINGYVAALSATEDAVNLASQGAANGTVVTLNGGTGTNGDILGKVTFGAGADTLAVTSLTGGSDAAITGAIDFGAGTDAMTVSGTGTSTFTGAISGLESLAITGANGVANFRGNVTNAITTTSVGTGSTLSIGGGAGNSTLTWTGSITGAGTLTLNGDDTDAVGHTITGSVGTTTQSLAKLNVGLNNTDGGGTATDTHTITGNLFATNVDFNAATVAGGGTIGGTLALTAAAADSTVSLGTVTTAVNGDGFLNLVPAGANTITATSGNIGTSTFGLNGVTVGSDNGVTTLNANGNIYATQVTLNDRTDNTLEATLNLLGTSGTVSALIDGNAAGAGNVVVGNGTTASAYTFTNKIGNAAGVDLFNVKALSTANLSQNAKATAVDDTVAGILIDGTLNVVTTDANGAVVINTTAGDIDFNGTVAVSGTQDVTFQTAGTNNDILIDGTFGTALNTGKVLNLIGVDNQSDILVGASANTTMTISNTIVTTGDVVFGAGGATGKTVTLNIARTSQYNASSTVPVLVFNAADDDVDNTGILAVTVSGNGIYGFDNGDLITVIDSNVNAELDGVDTTYTAQIAAGRVILRDTALVDLQDNGSDAQDLKVKVVHNNVNNVLTSSYAANTGAAILSINDANYAGTGGTEWGTTGVSGPLGAIAPNSAAEAGVGGGNTLRVARNNLLAAPTAESATNIAESLAPMVDGGSMVGAMNATNGSFNVTGDRLASLRGDATGMAAGNGTQGHRFWIQGFGSAATQDRRDGVDGYDADTFGMAVGLDTETLNSNGILGVALSYANTDVDSNAGFGGTSDVDSYQVTLYGDYDLDQATFINGMLAYSWHDIDTTRNNVGGIVGATARGSNDADQWTAQANLGRDYAYDSMTLTPSLLANWSHYNADDYTETGAGNANLIVDSDSVSVFELGVGLNASWAYQTASGMDVEPSLHAGYRYDFIGDEVSTTNRFVGGGPTFQADGADPSKHGFNVGGAMALYTTDAWEFTANYDYDFRSDYDAHSGYIRAGVKF